MENSKQLTDNELIAEFMGLVRHEADASYNIAQYYKPVADKRKRGDFVAYYDNLGYDKRWERLMPVVEKIEQVLSVPNASKTKGWDHWNNVFDGRVDTDIKVAYACVVEFIKWYEKQDKNK